ncbi:MAG: DUF4147 domain-containing protein [Pseudomonadota bacterium]
MADRENLERFWRAGVAAVDGEAATRRALAARRGPDPAIILAVGKAAAAMAAGARAVFDPATPTLVLTKHDHAEGIGAHPAVTVIEAGHPVPDAASFAAGAALTDWVGRAGSDDDVLMLVSGGASALVEKLRAGVTAADLEAETRSLLAAGADIAAINARRRTFSTIKGGGLWAGFHGRAARVLAISDVEGDGIGTIGSGIGAPPPAGAAERADVTAEIIASNAHARRAVAEAAEAAGLTVAAAAETLYGPVEDAGARIAAAVEAGPAGLYIFGGEPTVTLPETPGRGGRNQALALLLARRFAGRSEIQGLVGGTDGTDGPTDAAGGFFDQATWTPAGEAALATASAYDYLTLRDALFRTGPTGTNVMDLALVLKTANSAPTSGRD